MRGASATGCRRCGSPSIRSIRFKSPKSTSGRSRKSKSRPSPSCPRACSTPSRPTRSAICSHSSNPAAVRNSVFRALCVLLRPRRPFDSLRADRGRDPTNRLLAANFVVSPVKHDFAGSGALFPKVGASLSKGFAFFHQTGDDFAKPGSPGLPGPRGAAGQAGRFSRRFCGVFVWHFAAASRARQTAKWPASERKAAVVRGNSRFLRLDFAF